MTLEDSPGPVAADDYLARVHSHLRGLPAQEQADLLDEIASHIESGQSDPQVGEAQVMAELGSPEQMGRGLRGIHRPHRLADLLLALAPNFLLTWLVTFVLSRFYGPTGTMSAASPYVYLGGRISLLVGILLAGVGWRRRSAPLAVFWLSSALGTLVSLMTREARFLPGQERIAGSALESLVWYAVLLGLLAWLVWTLKQQRFDRLLVVFSMLPLLLAAANYSTGQILLAGSATVRYGLVVMPSGLVFTLAYLAAWPGGIALFFLCLPRDPRWLGLLLMALYYAYPNLSAYRASPGILIIWSALVGVVLLAWGWDRVERAKGGAPIGAGS
jgi:hypothetical protein